jgi:hypothetical protein
MTCPDRLSTPVKNLSSGAADARLGAGIPNGTEREVALRLA